jgi:hypothetical protein
MCVCVINSLLQPSLVFEKKKISNEFVTNGYSIRLFEIISHFLI